LCYIDGKFWPTLDVVDIPLLLIKQLDNVIKLIELNLRSSLLVKSGVSAFEEPGSFIAEYDKVKRRPKPERKLLFDLSCS